jgi:predicted enzyme related to lactoylglutathione lyase
MEEMGTGGALQQVDGYEPSAQGTIVYFYMGEDLSEALARVEPAGGKILTPKTLISEEFGYYAHFLDTEGNRVGLHSQK